MNVYLGLNMNLTLSVSLKILVMKDSTEGVAEGQTTASAGSTENKGVSEVEEKDAV